jgi:ABC-2 type transport system permease protein
MKLPGFASRTLAISSKEMLHIARDPRVVYLALVTPIVLLVLFGFGVTFDVDEIPMAVVDGDRTPASRRLALAFEGTNVFHAKAAFSDPAAVEERFRRNEEKAALLIAPGYQRDLKRGRAARAQLLVDGADNTTAQVAIAYAAGVAQNESRRWAQAGLRSEKPPLEGKVRVRFNPEMKSARFLVPGLIPMVLAMLAVLLTALAVSREWERGSMEQLFATPVGRAEVIVGKLLPYLAIGAVQVLLLTTLATWLFDVPILGSLPLVGAVALLFLLGMLGQGLLISVLAKNQLVASQAGVVSAMLPSMLLSGFMFPIENMPAVLKAISSVVPARYFIHALRSILLKGGGVAEISPDLLALGAFAAVVTGLAVLRFRRRIA